MRYVKYLKAGNYLGMVVAWSPFIDYFLKDIRFANVYQILSMTSYLEGIFITKQYWYPWNKNANNK